MELRRPQAGLWFLRQDGERVRPGERPAGESRWHAKAKAKANAAASAAAHGAVDGAKRSSSLTSKQCAVDVGITAVHKPL